MGSDLQPDNHDHVNFVDWARPWDVVVVGGRVAGAVTAHALAPYARDILVVERTKPGRFWPQQMSWDGSTNRVWADLGLTDSVLACGAPRLRGITRRIGEVTISGRFAVDGEHSYRMSVARDRLDAALIGRASRHDNVRVLQPAQVLAPIVDERRVTGVRITYRGRTADVAATLVIFADGRRSQAGSWLGVSEYESVSSPWTALISYRTGLSLAEDHMWFSRQPGSLLTVIPTGEQQWCVGTMLHEQLIAGQGRPPARLHEQVALDDPDLGPALAAGRPVSGIGGAGRMRMYRRPMTGPGWCLVGDSGLHLDPMSAMGGRAALITAQLLRDHVAARGSVSADPVDYADLGPRRDVALEAEWAATRRDIGVEDGASDARDLPADGAMLDAIGRSLVSA